MQYQIDAERTEAPVDTNMLLRAGNPSVVRLNHASCGLTTEIGEFADQLKRHIYYGKELDKVNLIEELGDILWYVGVACNALETDMQEVMDRNIEKLKKRFPEKFTEKDAIERDLVAEREVLES